MFKIPSPQGIFSPKLDIAFKMLFCDERRKEILIDFLKSILKEPSDEIEGISFVNPFTPKEYDQEKYGVLDVKVRMKSGGVIDAEIQVLNVAHMPERILFYLSRIFTQQIKSGEPYANLKKAISIVICDFDIVKDTNDYHNTFWFINPENGAQFSRSMEIHTLELGKIPKESDNTKKYNWLSFINAKSKEEFEMFAQENAAIQTAYEQLQQLSMDSENRELYNARLKALMDEASRIESAIEEGREEGRERERQETVLRLHAKGKSMEDIMDATNLSFERIHEIIGQS